MKNIYCLILFFFIIGCTSNKSVYWCGDHPCVNKKEKEAYFRKTMIVEVKELKDTAMKNNSDIEEIKQQAKIEEKRRIQEEKALVKQAKLEEKRRIQEEKALAKQAKLEEKRRIQEEKVLAKQIEQDEKILNKIKKMESKETVNNSSVLKKTSIKSTNFNELVENITKKNTFRPYPDINDIPN